MKLYLSSYRIPTPDALFEIAGAAESQKVAVIPNAKDYYADRARAIKLAETTTFLGGLGLSNEIVDLRNYRSGADLEKKLSSYTMLWVCGGNAFCLRDEMQKSGFDSIINDLLKDGLVYAGESAGACVAGNSLKGLESADDPAFTENCVRDGLGLVSSFILPHVGNAMFADAINEARDAHIGESIIELTDTQALIVDGPQHTVTDSL